MRNRHIARRLKLFGLVGLTLMLGFSEACVTVGKPDVTLKTRGRSNPLLNLWLPFAPARVRQSYDHTIIKTARAKSDCQPFCPKIDPWRYQFQPAGHSSPITDTKPISTQKAFWKVPDEARIIAFSLFGKNEQYYKGLIDHLDSFQHVKKINKISDPIWGFETFTVRVYVAQRNPQNRHLGELKNETDPEFIQELLRRGCEVVYVDNGLPEVRKDGTFWRFLVAAEEMPKGQTLRYLVRDADWLFTAAEAYAVAEWIRSGLRFHRMHLVAICIGPLTASWWGGLHQGTSEFTDLKVMMESFPYRYQYGDDELFTRDVIWPRIKYSGSVLTHIYPRGFKTYFANPYVGSCEEPTQSFCDAMKPGGQCPDVEGPIEIDYPYIKLAMRQSLKDFYAYPEVFDLRLDTKRGQDVRTALSTNYK